jgi:serine/threonine protein kinase
VDFLENLLKGAVGGIGSYAGGALFGWFIGRFKTAAGKLKSEDIKTLLSQLGTVTPQSVVDLVERQLGNDEQITDDQRAELVQVLIQLTKGARTLTTHGTPRSSYVRCEKLIDQLLRGLEVKRKKGESVAPGQNWVLEQFLGLGAFGEVWLAVNQKNKALPRRAYKFFTQEKATEWLLQENNSLSAVMAQLGDHPGIARLEDVCVEGQFPFLAFEYVGGGSLEDWLFEDASVRPPLDVYELMQAVVCAVAEAHRKKIYHHDLKPANILLTNSEKVLPKVTDFGLATAEPAPGGGASVGASLGLVQVGTPMYWPPEAHEMGTTRKLGQDDVFALGVIWYQLVVNRLERPPYDFEEVLRTWGQDTHTVRLISRCLAHPDRRFANAGELEQAMSSADLPRWPPVPDGCYDVSHVVREYIATVKP